MGVRAYTHAMHTSLLHTRLPSRAHIVIDCSDFDSSPAEASTMERLVDWVREHPAASSVHVTLRSQLSGQVPRRCQMLLQALGCTVTAKVRC